MATLLSDLEPPTQETPDALLRVTVDVNGARIMQGVAPLRPAELVGDPVPCAKISRIAAQMVRAGAEGLDALATLAGHCEQLPESGAMLREAVARATSGRGASVPITLVDGVEIDLLRPDPSAISPRVLATGLANLCRYSGQIGDAPGGAHRYYSVAEHCEHVAAYVPRPLAFAALLHDAAEGLGLCDLPSQLKAVLPWYKDIEAVVDGAIAERFGIELDALHAPEIKEVDRRLRANEQHFLRGIVSRTTEPLPGVRLRCSDPAAAAASWLATFYALGVGSSGVDRIFAGKHPLSPFLAVLDADGAVIERVAEVDTVRRVGWVSAPNPRDPMRGRIHRKVAFDRLAWRPGAPDGIRRETEARYPVLFERFPSMAGGA